MKAHWRFPATIFLSAFLLFQVQPMVARALLPQFGGTPAVWSTCLLFFQAVLLAGYCYAHWNRWRWMHLIALAASALFLPLAVRPSSGGDPTLQILAILTLSAGVPYFVLSSTAPLLQRWFAAAQPDESPWRLYALSNAGSFIALLSYPFAVEPFVRLGTQMRIWSGLYVAFLVLCGFTAVKAQEPVPAPTAEPASEPGPAWPTILLWLALATAGSIILLATTNEISQEVAVNPFLWVAPLSLYLLTFVLTFESDRWYRRPAYAGLAGMFTAIACAVSAAANSIPVLWQLGVYLAALFFTCMLCNGELVRRRPPARYLTSFYLTVAAGGALGGVFVALIAPRIFTEFNEYPIGLGAACALGLLCWLSQEGLSAWRGFDARVPLSSLLLGLFTAGAFILITGGQGSLLSVRNFYGILRVSQDSDRIGVRRKLTHGRIDHGFQYQDAQHRDWPTSYYGPDSGVGLALQSLNTEPSLPSPRRIAVVGLGTGTIAAWGQPGDEIHFYEINPAVIRIANTWFTYLRDSKAQVSTVLGDARIQLAAEAARGKSHDYDAIAVDAFSSDSIPVHLLTIECADLYRDRLKPGGILLLHITNKTLDLEPVARGLAQHLGWQVKQIISDRDPDLGESAAQWVILGSDISNFTHNPGWTAINEAPLTWTDDFSSLWHVLRF